MKIGWFDRALASVAPRYGLRRLQARAQIQALGRSAASYDATGGGRRTQNWMPRHSDANAAAQGSIVRLRNLSRDLRRNNSWAKRSLQIIGNNTIGWGIEGSARLPDAELAARMTEHWLRWADSTACDYDGRLNFYGLQRLVMDTVVESGECLIVKQTARSSDNLPVPMRLRVIEPDFLDISRDLPGMVDGSGNLIIQGIEFDGRGRRVAYHLYENHPGASAGQVLTFGTITRRVPASDVLHIYRVDRPGQVRGVPWMAAAISKLYDLDEYDDAKLIQQKIAACFGAFVTDLDGSGTPLGQLVNDEANPNDPQLEQMEPGRIQYLQPGKDITFASPPPVNDHDSFVTTNLRRVAATMSVPYEEIANDYSQVNFSSARMSRLAHYASVNDWRWNMIVPQLCDPVWAWFTTLASGLEDWWPAGLDVPAEWTPPPLPMIEPEKEGLAYSRLMRNGVMTLGEVIRERGGNARQQMAEIAATNDELDRLGIVLDSDPRNTSQNGQLQGEAAAASAPEPPEPPEPPGDEEPEGEEPEDAEDDTEEESGSEDEQANGRASTGLDTISPL